MAVVKVDLLTLFTSEQLEVILDTAPYTPGMGTRGR